MSTTDIKVGLEDLSKLEKSSMKQAQLFWEDNEGTRHQEQHRDLFDTQRRAAALLKCRYEIGLRSLRIITVNDIKL